MSREIKFRALTKYNNIMVFGDLIHTPEKNHRIIWFERKDEFDFKTFNELIQSSTVGQFTGLHDKNGVEIYEGDILGEKGRHEEDNIYVCEYISDEARFLFTSPYDGESFIFDEVSDLEVIGNIYQNPELLK